MNGNQVGLNGQEASRSLNEIEKSYRQIVKNFNSIQGGIVNKIGTCWYGRDAIEFTRDKFKPAVESIGQEVQRVFQSVNDTITQNAKNFEAKHHTGVFSPVTHVPENISIDASVVLENHNGFIGLENIKQLEESRQYWLQMLREQEMLLDNMKNAAARSGFYGESQQEKLNQSIHKIKTSIDEVTKELQSATQNKIEETEAEERSIAQKNASTF